MQFTFAQEIIERVKTNWLTESNKHEFEKCETDSDLCLTFVRVSNMTDRETGLADEISKVVVSQIIIK